MIHRLLSSAGPLRAVLLLAACMAAACGGERAPGGTRASAPDSAAEAKADEGRIAGFASVPWGTTRQQIQAARGEPDTVIAYSDGVVGLAYQEPEKMYGASVKTVFLVDPEHGFFRGGYAARPGRVAECEGVFGLMEQGVANRYPGLKPESERGNGSALPFCEALRNGQAARITRWRDDAGNVIMLMAMPGTAEITLFHSNARANEWEAARSRAKF